MLVSDFVIVNVNSPRKVGYWSKRGFECVVGDAIKVPVNLIKSGEHRVEVICDACWKQFSCYLSNLVKQKSGEFHLCYGCSRKCADHTKTSIAAKKRWAKVREDQRISEFHSYRRIVRNLTKKTYLQYVSGLNPDNLPRTLCGVDGGYQLDHKRSIRLCFDEGVSPEQCASVENLQLLPWRENSRKGQ